MEKARTTYLSLGSNQGNKLEHLQKAIDLIDKEVGIIEKISSVFKTKSWGFDSDDFYNICVKISTKLTAIELMPIFLKIEENLGRIRTESTTYSSRIIDIDVLLFDDEVILSKDLIVPHPRMLERKFVLTPLVEIVPNYVHPTEKQSIIECLQNCNDTTDIEKLDVKINKPKSLFEKYNYIAIEGNIGAGKTSLAKMIGDDYNAKLVLERFADNPFLPKYYKDMERYAFPLEMSFLADRYNQLSDDLAQFDLFKNFIVSDYYIFKSLIFAQVSLHKDEYALYRKVFDVMYKEISKPDLYVYLYQNTERLLDNIKKRGRDYEQDIKPEYLEKIHAGYTTFIKSEEELNTLVIDVSEMDFVNNTDDYRSIINTISEFKN